MERKPNLLTLIVILWSYAFLFTVHGPIEISDLEGKWKNDFGTKLEVKETSVWRNDEYWGKLEETDDNIIINGWTLNKMSEELLWRKNNKSASWVKARDDNLRDSVFLKNRIKAIDHFKRDVLTQRECENETDMIGTLEKFESGDEILAIPHTNNVNKYHCFLQKSLLSWMNTSQNKGKCIHPILRRLFDVQDIVIGRFEKPGTQLLKVKGRVGFLSGINGIYIKQKSLHQGRPFYLQHDSKKSTLYWNSRVGAWMIGDDLETNKHYAYLQENIKYPHLATKHWMVNSPAEGFLQDTNITVETISIEKANEELGSGIIDDEGDLFYDAEEPSNTIFLTRNLEKNKDFSYAKEPAKHYKWDLEPEQRIGGIKATTFLAKHFADRYMDENEVKSTPLIYASPFLRSIQTALPVVKALNTKLKIKYDLFEIENGFPTSEELQNFYKNNEEYIDLKYLQEQGSIDDYVQKMSPLIKPFEFMDAEKFKNLTNEQKREVNKNNSLKDREIQKKTFEKQRGVANYLRDTQKKENRSILVIGHQQEMDMIGKFLENPERQFPENEGDAIVSHPYTKKKWNEMKTKWQTGFMAVFDKCSGEKYKENNTNYRFRDEEVPYLKEEVKTSTCTQ